MSFHLRTPSAGWEPLPLAVDAPRVVWSWFKPPYAPNSVALHVPTEIWQTTDPAHSLTVRQLAIAAGIEALQGWTLYGQFFPLGEQTAPFLDVPLAAPVVGGDPLIILWCNAAASAQVPAPTINYAARPAAVGGGSLLAEAEAAPLFESIASHWMAIQRMEADVRRIRSQLSNSVHKLASLNRDLHPEERVAADALDLKEWTEARRWLHDASAALAKSIKQIDTGIISGAGQRNHFEDIFRQYVEPRVVFPGLKQAAIDFEMYHRTVHHVMQAAQAALSKGSTDGERRANTVLHRIAAKVRQHRGGPRKSRF